MGVHGENTMKFHWHAIQIMLVFQKGQEAIVNGLTRRKKGGLERPPYMAQNIRSTCFSSASTAPQQQEVLYFDG
jgi:hypothetical protein